MIVEEDGLLADGLVGQNSCPLRDESLPVCRVLGREGGHVVGVWV